LSGWIDAGPDTGRTAFDLNLTAFGAAYYPLLKNLSCLFPAIRVKEAQQGAIDDEEAEDRRRTVTAQNHSRR
jgi:hypothetical protein